MTGDDDVKISEVEEKRGFVAPEKSDAAWVRGFEEQVEAVKQERRQRYVPKSQGLATDVFPFRTGSRVMYVAAALLFIYLVASPLPPCPTRGYSGWLYPPLAVDHALGARSHEDLVHLLLLDPLKPLRKARRREHDVADAISRLTGDTCPLSWEVGQWNAFACPKVDSRKVPHPLDAPEWGKAALKEACVATVEDVVVYLWHSSLGEKVYAVAWTVALAATFLAIRSSPPALPAFTPFLLAGAGLCGAAIVASMYCGHLMDHLLNHLAMAEDRLEELVAERQSGESHAMELVSHFGYFDLWQYRLALIIRNWGASLALLMLAQVPNDEMSTYILSAPICIAFLTVVYSRPISFVFHCAAIWAGFLCLLRLGEKFSYRKAPPMSGSEFTDMFLS
eukprot:Sspe_Gene.108766::Locus_87891_Transcript_1_1_Confidence_1.000_Length_1499::g.108766::m.108766